MASFLIDKLKQALPALAVVSLITGLLIGSVILIKVTTGIPMSEFVRDSNSIADAPFYTGFYSQIGLFLWFSSAAICFFLAQLSNVNFSNQQTRAFFLASGALSLLLGVDDAFLLHEEALPMLGIDEKFTLITYMLLVLAYLFRFYNYIFTTSFVVLGFGFTFFAVSVGADAVIPEQYHSYAVEDGAKMAGLLAWFYYFFSTAKFEVSKVLNSPP